MKNLFRNYYDRILVILAVIFVVAAVFMYIFGARFLFENFDNTTELKNINSGITHFNIAGAEKLGLPKQ